MITEVTNTKKESQLINIMNGDPAEKFDSFGIAGVELNMDNEEISIKFARHYKKTPFAVVANDLLPIVNNIKPKFFGLETNRDGKRAINEFLKMGIFVQGINTVPKLSDENRIKRWHSMDKAYTVHWLADKLKKGKIIIPKKPSPHVIALIEQMSIIKGFVNPNGTMSYKARNGRHDDLFMAFLLCCHVCRMFLLQKKMVEK